MFPTNVDDELVVSAGTLDEVDDEVDVFPAFVVDKLVVSAGTLVEFNDNVDVFPTDVDDEVVVNAGTLDEVDDVVDVFPTKVLEDVTVSSGRQVPLPAGLPLSHLQLEEQPSPETVFPSSHSSPSAGSNMPSPQPAGVAPRLMMYGRPIVPSPKVSDPTPMMS